jgi:hypothetical protein
VTATLSYVLYLLAPWREFRGRPGRIAGGRPPRRRGDDDGAAMASWNLESYARVSDRHRQQAHPETSVVAFRTRILDKPVEAHALGQRRPPTDGRRRCTNLVAPHA